MRYNTEKKKKLTELLRNNPDRQYTVDEIAEKLGGRSTVYRIVGELVDDGSIRRTVKGNSRRFLYQYSDEHCKEHLHLKCTECGKLIHLDDGTTQSVLSRIAELKSFEIDENHSILMGICARCRKNEKKDN